MFFCTLEVADERASCILKRLPIAIGLLAACAENRQRVLQFVFVVGPGGRQKKAFEYLLLLHLRSSNTIKQKSTKELCGRRIAMVDCQHVLDQKFLTGIRAIACNQQTQDFAPAGIGALLLNLFAPCLPDAIELPKRANMGRS